MSPVVRMTFAWPIFDFDWGEQLFAEGRVWRIVWLDRRNGIIWVIPDYPVMFWRWLAGKLGAP